jgi:hypothetical protein
MKKINFIAVLLFAVLVSGCKNSSYLPTYDKIDVNAHGSYIYLSEKRSHYLRGELIALDSVSVVVLNEKTHQCIAVPVTDIRKFSLTYARPSHYGWSILLFSVLCVSHGMFAVFSLPINLIVTISVTSGGEHAFTYSEKDMTYKKLKMFARFPQGIPLTVNLADIR